MGAVVGDMDVPLWVVALEVDIGDRGGGGDMRRVLGVVLVSPMVLIVLAILGTYAWRYPAGAAVLAVVVVAFAAGLHLWLD